MVSNSRPEGRQNSHDNVCTPDSHSTTAELAELLKRIALALEAIQASTQRIAEHVAPDPADIVGTPYIAGLLSCTTVWIADMVRTGVIPKHCVVTGTGNGKPWKFHRHKIDHWIETR